MRKLMWFSIGFTLSCIIGIYLLSGTSLGWLALIVGCIAIAFLFIKNKICTVTGVLLLGFTVGVLWMQAYHAFYLQPADQFDGRTVTTTIEIADYSYPTTYAGAADGKIQLNGKIYHTRVYFDRMVDLKPGDLVHGAFRFAMTTPGGDAQSEYYQGKGIFLLAYAEGEIVTRPVDQIPLRYFATELRQQIIELLNRIFPADTLGFARALLLGDSSMLTYEEDTAFKVSGIRHIIAVSGLHVSILFSLAYTLACRRRVSTAVIGIPVLILFAAVAGFSPSIIRACVMQVLVILALLLNREYDPPTALAFAVIVILVLNPMTITSVSFQLSVGCMIGVFLFCKPIQSYIFRKMGAPTGKTVKARFARWFSSGVAVTVSAMAVTTPLVAWYFGLVSVIGVLTNLMTLWAVSFVFYGFIFACLCGALWLPLGKGIAWLVSWLARYVLLVAKTLASVPVAAVYTCSVYIVLWIAVCYLMLLIFLVSRKKHPVLLASCMLICLCASLAASYVVPRQDDFRVTVFDVGEGQAILLQNRGKHYLVDCGGQNGEEAADTVAETLLSQGVFSLDGIILTHYDGDHSNGISNLLTRIKTKSLYLPEIPDDGNFKQLFTQTYNEKIHWIQETTALDTIICIPAPVMGEDENESSLCVLFQPDNYDILITGDRGATGEKALLESFDLPQLELLVAGHHGAADSTDLPLLSATMPDTVVISTGARYGHPSSDVLYRLALFGCKVWRTDQDGTIIFKG